MKTSKLLAYLLALVTIAGAASAMAADYSVFNIGIGGQYWDAKDIDDFDTDGMWGGNIILRIRPIEYLGIDIRGGFSGNNDGNSYRIDGRRYERDVTFECVPVEAGLVLMLPLGDAFTIYGGPGVGYYWYNLNINEHSTRHGHHYREEYDDDIDLEDDFGWYALVGVNFRLAPHFSIFGEARYTDTETKLEDVDNAAKIDCSGVGFQAGLMFDF